MEKTPPFGGGTQVYRLKIRHCRKLSGLDRLRRRFLQSLDRRFHIEFFDEFWIQLALIHLLQISK
jgi:hypothetical protein